MDYTPPTDEPDYTYATPEPPIEPATMPSGEGTRFWEEGQ